MNKFKYATIIAVVAVSGIIGFMSMKNNQKYQLSEYALANVEALSTAKEAYKLTTCYEKVISDKKSMFSYLKCYEGTTNSQIYNCSGAESIKGYLELLVNTYNCVQ